jgi:hypothetical protein
MPSAPDPFESPRLLIAGARHDVENLDTGFKAFVSGCKAVPIEERDPKTRERVGKLRFPQKMPGSLRVLASNALNNLRHALDQTVNCASLQLGGDDRNYFPFAQDATDLDRLIKDQCKGVPSVLYPLLKGFQPYPGGDDLLCVLRVSGKNKHREVLELKPELAGASYRVDRMTLRGPFRFGSFIWDSAKQELEYARVGPGGYLEGQMKGKVSLRITLRDTPAARGEPAAGILDALASRVEGVLLRVEAETARLRRIP